jgi:hypothetical protein
MHHTIALALFALAIHGGAYAQTPAVHSPAQEKDRLGLSCAQILKMPSQDWIEYSSRKSAANAANAPENLLNANAAYGKCYDARTDALAASLARTGKGPSKATRAEFAAFEADVKQFESKALANAKPANDTRQKSYADLYEKQFRYQFYDEFPRKTIKPGVASAATSAKPGTADSTAAKTPPAPGNSAPHEATAEERAHSDADPVTQAKNRFGKILEALPEDQMHEVHAAFSEVIGAHALSESMRLAVYRYAIYLLQPAGSAQPEAPPF